MREPQHGVPIGAQEKYPDPIADRSLLHQQRIRLPRKLREQGGQIRSTWHETDRRLHRLPLDLHHRARRLDHGGCRDRRQQCHLVRRLQRMLRRHLQPALYSEAEHPGLITGISVRGG